jgi:hypothetical protein
MRAATAFGNGSFTFSRARNRMTSTIRQKLYGLGLLGLFFSVAIGLTGWYGIRLVGGGVQEVGATSSATRNHMEASAFLDFTRADVSKIFTATGDKREIEEDRTFAN